MLNKKSNDAGGRHVAVIWTIIPRYKAWLFDELDSRYSGRLTVVHGSERPGSVPEDIGDEFNVRDDRLVSNTYFDFMGLELIWIPSVRWVLRNKPDVVVLINEVRILSNYPIQIWARLTGREVVFYTHGFNHQASLTRKQWFARVVERIRLFQLRRCTSIIVYDDRGKEHLRSNGINCPIHNSNNTLDTRPIKQYYESHDHAELRRQVRQELDLDEDTFVIMFIGRLVPEKRVDVMIDATRETDSRVSEKVVGLIVGDGPDRADLEKQAEGADIRFAGYQEGPDLYRFILACDIVFVPGMVGLPIVDTFCAGRPFATIDHDFHSPEVSCLKDGENGILLSDFDIDKAATAFEKLVRDRDSLERLCEGARHTAAVSFDPGAMVDSMLDAISHGDSLPGGMSEVSDDPA